MTQSSIWTNHRAAQNEVVLPPTEMIVMVVPFPCRHRGKDFCIRFQRTSQSSLDHHRTKRIKVAVPSDGDSDRSAIPPFCRPIRSPSCPAFPTTSIWWMVPPTRKQVISPGLMRTLVMISTPRTKRIWTPMTMLDSCTFSCAISHSSQLLTFPHRSDDTALESDHSSTRSSQEGSNSEAEEDSVPEQSRSPSPEPPTSAQPPMRASFDDGEQVKDGPSASQHSRQ